MVTSPHSLGTAAGVDVLARRRLRDRCRDRDQRRARGRLSAYDRSRRRCVLADPRRRERRDPLPQRRRQGGGGRHDRRRFEARGLNEIPLRGIVPATLTVPGAVASWIEAHSAYGRLPLRRCAGKRDRLCARRLSGHGAPCTACIEMVRDELLRSREAAALFFPQGAPATPGERLANANLARTLQAIAATDGRASTRARWPPRWCASPRKTPACSGLPISAGRRRSGASRSSAATATSRSSTRRRRRRALPCSRCSTCSSRIDLHRKHFLGPDHVHLLVQAKQIAYHDRDQVLADPALRRRAGRAADIEAIRGRARPADRRKVGIAMGHGAVFRQPVRRHGLCRRCRSRRQCGVADPKPVWRIRILRGCGKHRRHPAKPRRLFLARSATIPIASSPARSRCIR